MGAFSARLDLLLAVLVLAGFAVAWLAQGTLALTRVSELSAFDVPRSVVVTGQARWLNGSRMQLCQGSACIRVILKVPLESSWVGQSVAVQGRFRDGTLWADAGGVDVLG
ncbi:hypothetical protein HYV43_03835 [Candidatus Micrarchaeota archaeon]|nr:hypothetical protein [Candidatus Micrarchaeota archaeon]